MDIRDKRIIVTGGAKGIGKVLVDRFVAQRAQVGILDIDQYALDELNEAHAGLHCANCDISQPADVEKAVDEFCDLCGGVDILVNNAGILHNELLIKYQGGLLKTHDLDAWSRVINANLNSVFYVTSNVVKKMISQKIKGVVVNVGSVCSVGNLGQGAYSASKAAVNALTVVWAKELGFFGIRVAGINPGFTMTDTAVGSMPEHALQDWKKRTPLKRFAEPAEIAEGILFIIDNDFYNGRVLDVDGGLRL